MFDITVIWLGHMHAFVCHIVLWYFLMYFNLDNVFSLTFGASFCILYAVYWASLGIVAVGNILSFLFAYAVQ